MVTEGSNGMVVLWLNNSLGEEILANTISLQRMPYEHI